MELLQAQLRDARDQEARLLGWKPSSKLAANWNRNYSRPSHPRLLTVIARDPEGVQRALQPPSRRGGA
ncbi:MAG: hypothetical protein WBQ37_08970 [Candidatus Competibacter sp.]